MKATFIRENIDFKRHQNSKASLGIGVIARIKELLDSRVESYRNKYSYDIKSPEEIIIIGPALNSSKKWEEDIPLRVIKYTKVDRFYYEWNKYKDPYGDWLKENSISIYDMKDNIDDINPFDPFLDLGEKCEGTESLKVLKTDRRESRDEIEKRAKELTEFYNGKYPPVEKFILVKKLIN